MRRTRPGQTALRSMPDGGQQPAFAGSFLQAQVEANSFLTNLAPSEATFRHHSFELRVGVRRLQQHAPERQPGQQGIQPRQVHPPNLVLDRIHRHVQDKEELLVLLADEISGEIPVVDDRRPWQDQLADLAYRVRRTLLSHRDAARLLADTRPAGLRRPAAIDTILGLLLADDIAADDSEGLFRFGLDLWIRGLGRLQAPPA